MTDHGSARKLGFFSYNLPVRYFLGGYLFLLIATGVSAQTLTGLVVDTNGAAIRDAGVSLQTRRAEVANVRTDAEGRFTLSGKIINNASRLVVYASRFSTFERRLKNDGVRDFTIVLQPAPPGGRVTVSYPREAARHGGMPASIVVLSSGLLDESPAQTIDDALRQVAGFTLFRRSSSKTSNPTTQGANLRGVSGSGAARTAVVFEGLSLNDAFGGWTYWSRIPSIAVEEVEVLRGGASSLYGTGGLSGAISLLPKRRDNPRMLRLQTSAGSQGTFDGSVVAGYSNSMWTFDVAGEGFKTGGYTPIASEQRGFVDSPSNSRHHNLLAGVERRFGPRGSGNTGRIFARGNLFSEDRDNGTTLTDNATYFRQVSAGVDRQNWTIGRLQARAYLQSQVYDQTFSAVSADRNDETLTRIQRVPSEVGGGNLFWIRGFGNHYVSSSFDIRSVRGFTEETGVASGVATSALRSGGEEGTTAFFIQDVFNVDTQLTLSFSARYDRWVNYGASSTNRSLATGAVNKTAFPDRSDSAFSPRVAAIFTANRFVSLFGSYSRSFRAPTLNELYRGFRVGNVVTLANENLRAETADTFEGGVALLSMNRRVSVRANFFTTVVSEPVVSVTLSSTAALVTRQRQNAGETRSTGLEVDAEFAIRQDLSVTASYLLVHASVTKFNESPVLVGKLLPQVPHQQLNLRLRYRANERWFFGVQSRAASGPFEDDLNALRLRPYLTVDASSSFRASKRVEIYGAAENLFNSRYDIGLTPARSVAAPFSVRLGLRLDLSK